MRRLLACAMLASVLFWPLAAAGAMARGPELTISTGQRVDDLDWNIAGIAPAPPADNFVNVLSELTWSDLESQEIRGLLRVFVDRLYLRGAAGVGFINSGRNQDSDFKGNDRTLEYSRSNNSADDGTVWDVSGGLGYLYEFPIPGGTLELIPVAGVSYHKQNLTLTDGVQTVDTIPPVVLGPFPGLNSTFEAGWGGPWAGGEASYRTENFRIFGSFEYHLVYYMAKANWNLRSIFAHPVSFEHWATGSGIVFSGGAEYNIGQQWSLMAAFSQSDFSASDGTDRTYFFDGTATDTPLNEVNWESRSVFIGLNLRF